MRRALVMFVEDRPYLIANSKWLYQSWKHVACADTDLVFMGTPDALRELPSDVIRIEQEPVADQPDWLDYRYVNSVACLNGPGASVLNDYDQLLRTDVDVFLTPAWKRYWPSDFTTGTGGYSNDDHVRENTRRIASRFGLVHRGIDNIGSTLYGPPALVRDVCELATDLCKYIRTVEFRDEEGSWPSWYAGVSLLYATEIAVNHLVPTFSEPSRKLDGSSTSIETVDQYPHIHCWHTDDRFSKFACQKGEYSHLTEDELNIDVICDYCTIMALRASQSGGEQ